MRREIRTDEKGIRNRTRRLTVGCFAGFVLILSTASLPVPVRADPAASGQELVGHHIEARITPQKGVIAVRDSISLPKGFPRQFTFLLHRALKPSPQTMGVAIRKEAGPHNAFTESYRVSLPPGVTTFVVTYQGVIHHPIRPMGKEQARGFSQTPGIISKEGAYLAGSSFWYPSIEGKLTSFALKVDLPAGWDAVSQGTRTFHRKGSDATVVQWESREPQDEIFLVAAQFTEYAEQSGQLHAMAFLRTPDRGLARKYLDAAVRYISMYEELIGPYPYAKFALVENFWETGLGMPSFTLLGPKIIRLPFIITSSYPHEILHNWWGNSVFPDYGKGNWSEGLTAYLSDHLFKEQEGGGAEYRQTTLQKYMDYALNTRDFPLTGFRSRHSSSSEAVGYGKSLMFFHMLRRELGDSVFAQGLQDFHERNLFRTASFGDLRKSFERVSGIHLGREFRQWVERTGAPRIRLSRAEVDEEEHGYSLALVLEQMQPGEAYLLRIPVAVTLEGQERAYQTEVEMDKKQVELRLHLPSRPLRLDIDPEFDLFRKLDRREIPPAISQVLGAEKMLVVLPSAAEGEVLQAYKNFSKTLSAAGPDEVEVKLDSDVKEFPLDRAVVVLGWENLFLEEVMSSLSAYDVALDGEEVRVTDTGMPKENHSVVLTARNPVNREIALAFVATTSGKSLPGLARKLPHYHKYSYLAFEGDEVVNVARGRWPVIDSPMTAVLSGREDVSGVRMGGLAERRPLISLPEVFSKDRMLETVTFLSGTELQGRGPGSEGLDRAAEYIAEKFREAGLIPAGDTEGSYLQTWEETMENGETDTARTVVLKNVIGVIPGERTDLAAESVVVGAHYDHLGLGWPDVREANRGKVHPGADDNASGVSVLIELARVLGKTHPERNVIFAAFTAEETGRRGSKYYVANEERYPLEKCIGMLNLDTVGRLGKNKLLVLGASSAEEWVHIFRGAGFVTGTTCEMVSENLDSSDQISFLDAGVPAVQLFAGPHADYHRPTDTADKIDAEGLVKVAAVAREVVEYLSGREGPLTGKSQRKTGSSEKKERKVSLGTIPDFTFTGKGVRLSGVVPGSPAEACGLKEGDVIIDVNSRAVHTLSDLSQCLKSLAPGNRISIIFLREGKEATVETEVKAK